MKSVIAAAILLVLSVGICLFFSAYTVSCIDILTRMTESLPQTPEQYTANTESVSDTVSSLTEYWSDAVSYFSYVCGYTALNRADEAVWNLYAAVHAKDYAAAMIAKYQLLDALRRMRVLEMISVSSVFIRHL